MNPSIQRILAIVVKELRQLRRDRVSFGMVVGLPLAQILIFGYAINTDVRHLRGAVADAAGTQLAQQLVQDIDATQVVDIDRQVASPAALAELMRRGEIDAGIVIPRDFERRLADPRRPAAQLIIDGSDPVLLGIGRLLRQMPPPDQRTPGVTAPVFELMDPYNPERRSAVQIVPGLVGVILTLTMVLFTAIALVRERERGTLELLITTPVSPSELMIGKVLPYVLIGLVQASFIILVGVGLFHVPIRGSLGDVYLAATLLIVANLTLGLLLSTVVKNQFQAMQMTIMIFLPSILLSGFMFPFAGMPAAARWLAEVLPLTHFVRLIRGLMLRGAGIEDLGGEAGFLIAFAAVFMVLAIRRFRKRLD